ncbi:MAG: glycosyltransferase family 39 protein [Alicyclobacillaceae bacterium]|nr:glycosyltransferase family 39 protein [Alicyclobacillaceae bacterium]
MHMHSAPVVNRSSRVVRAAGRLGSPRRPADRLDRTDTWVGLALIAMAACIRLYAVIRPHDMSLYGDMVHYDHSARLLLDRHVFSFWGHQPDAYVTPGYPLFLALCYALANLHSTAATWQIQTAQYVQALLSALTVGVLYWTSRRPLARPWAVAVSLMWTVYPPAVWSPLLLLTETLYLFLLMCFLWLFTVAAERRHPGWWLLCGIVLGLCGLVRPTVFPLVLSAGIYLLWRLRDGLPGKRALACFAGHVAGFVLPLIPWWVRNFRVFHKLVLTDTEVGNPLLFGSDPYFQAGPDLGRGLNQLQQKRLAIHRIVYGFEHQPGLYLKWYTVGKLHILFGQPWYHPVYATTGAVTVWLLHLHLVWVVVGAIGIVSGLWVPSMRFLSLVGLCLVALQLPFIPVNRYAFPVMPILFVASGFALQRALCWGRAALASRGVIA